MKLHEVDSLSKKTIAKRASHCQFNWQKIEYYYKTISDTHFRQSDDLEIAGHCHLAAGDAIIITTV